MTFCVAARKRTVIFRQRHKTMATTAAQLRETLAAYRDAEGIKKSIHKSKVGLGPT